MLPVTSRTPRTPRSRGLRRGTRPLAPILLTLAVSESALLKVELTLSHLSVKLRLCDTAGTKLYYVSGLSLLESFL